MMDIWIINERVQKIKIKGIIRRIDQGIVLGLIINFNKRLLKMMCFVGADFIK